MSTDCVPGSVLSALPTTVTFVPGNPAPLCAGGIIWTAAPGHSAREERSLNTNAGVRPPLGLLLPYPADPCLRVKLWKQVTWK